MWVNSEGTRVKDTIERINKIKLSSFSEEIFINTLFTLAYLPGQNMTDEEFMSYKINWLINNKKDQIISDFLNKNSEFPYKEKIIKYLVDENLAKGSITQACEKINLISNDVKDAYLDQFRILCFIKNGKQVEAQLVHDLLKEFKLSNKFFDDKVNYLLGLTDKEDKKIDDTNLLNFYLSSIAISDFDYKPNNKTDKKIWQYLAAANLLKIEDIENKDFTINEVVDLTPVNDKIANIRVEVIDRIKAIEEKLEESSDEGIGAIELDLEELQLEVTEGLSEIKESLSDIKKDVEIVKKENELQDSKIEAVRLKTVNPLANLSLIHTLLRSNLS